MADYNALDLAGFIRWFASNTNPTDEARAAINIHLVKNACEGRTFDIATQLFATCLNIRGKSITLQDIGHRFLYCLEQFLDCKPLCAMEMLEMFLLGKIFVNTATKAIYAENILKMAQELRIKQCPQLIDTYEEAKQTFGLFIRDNSGTKTLIEMAAIIEHLNKTPCLLKVFKGLKDANQIIISDDCLLITDSNGEQFSIDVEK